jgi:hypothetical protein
VTSETFDGHKPDADIFFKTFIVIIAFIDVNGQYLQPHAQAFRNIGGSAIKPTAIADDGRHEFSGVMATQIGAFKADARIGSAMGFAERIAAKAIDHFPDLISDRVG